MSGRPNNPVLGDYPYRHNNVFIMMRFREERQYGEILASVRASLKNYGLHGLRADDRAYHDSLWLNVTSYIEASDYGVAVFEEIDDQYFNPNVSLELGYMMALKKPVLILKEKRLKILPSDVAGHLYKSFDSYSIGKTIHSSITEWLRDRGIAKNEAEKLVLFVSFGGTCRCAMAKVALDQVLKGRRLPYRLRVVSVAHSFGAAGEASRGAQRAVREEYGENLLSEHRVTTRNKGLVRDADLILVMEESLRRNLPADKTHVFKPFLGGVGDIKDPWPDTDDKAPQRYKNCVEDIRSTVEAGADRILSYLAD